MRKISLTSKRLFLLVFIVLSLLVIVPTECYAKTSTVFGSTHNVDDDLEVQAMTQITQYIYDCSVASGYTSYNWAGSETTENHIYDAALGVYDTYSISFFIGHGGDEKVWRPFPEGQWWIYDSDGNRVYDREIYPYSECQNVRFVFLWSCDQGDTIGGTHEWSGIHYGMPFGWLHTNDLSTDGYANPDNNGYCFIGFDGGTQYITDEFAGHYALGYYFIGYFYRAALCGDKTINEALDYASQVLWQVNFGESILYNGIPDVGQMVVYGDGNLNVGKSVTAPTLPPAPPTHTLTIYLMSGDGTTSPSSGTYEYAEGTSVTVTASPYSGYMFDYWLLDGTKKYGYSITVTMNSDHTLKAYFRYSGSVGGPGGGCPILSVFDGSNYVTEGLLDIHDPDGIDVVRNHTLVTTPQPVNNAYLLRLTEHPQTHSYIDQVKLFATLEDGTTIRLPLISAVHSEHGNVLPRLLISDDVRTDTSGNQTIDLKFAALEDVSFIFQIEGNNAIYKTPK